MMDAQERFSNAQAVTVTAISENVIDLGKNAGAGRKIKVHANVQTAFAGGTSLRIGFRSASSAAGVAAGVEHWLGPAIVLADLGAGYKFNLPPLPPEHDRYVGLYYTVAGTMTAGKIDANLVMDEQTNGPGLAVDTNV